MTYDYLVHIVRLCTISKVNVVTGRPGWFKRRRGEGRGVKRTAAHLDSDLAAEFGDELAVDSIHTERVEKLGLKLGQFIFSHNHLG